MTKNQPDNGMRNRAKDTVKFKVKDNWWWVLPIIVPMMIVLVSDHFTLVAFAGQLERLDSRVIKQIDVQEKRQAAIYKKLNDQARISGSNQSLLMTIAEQNRLIQKQLWDLKNSKR